MRQVGVEAALLHQRQQVVEAGIGEVDLLRLGLQGGQLGGAQLPFEGRDLAGPAQQSPLRFRGGKTEGEAHREAIELGFRQG